MISLNYRDSRPIYEQIRDGLKKLIVTGALTADEKLPSVRSLATQLSINPNTIQRAYNELENEGYIYSIPGKGSFACGDVNADESRKRALEEKIRELAAELRYLGVSEEELLALVREEPVKLVTDTRPQAGVQASNRPEGTALSESQILGGPQAETGKEEPVKLVTEILGGPQAETGKEDK